MAELRVNREQYEGVRAVQIVGNINDSMLTVIINTYDNEVYTTRVKNGNIKIRACSNIDSVKSLESVTVYGNIKEAMAENIVHSDSLIGEAHCRIIHENSIYKVRDEHKRNKDDVRYRVIHIRGNIEELRIMSSSIRFICNIHGNVGRITSKKCIEASGKIRYAAARNIISCRKHISIKSAT